jgi:hypothetical protein
MICFPHSKKRVSITLRPIQPVLNSAIFADANITSCRFPFLGHPGDGVLVQVCHGETFDALLVLNPGDTAAQCRFDWAELGLTIPRRVLDWTNGREWAEVNELSLTLHGHLAMLLLYSATSGYPALSAR